MGLRYEIRLSGDIGDGLILMGKIIAEAAAIYDGLNAIQSQSYGEEARGEANRSEVIISDRDIIFPKVERPDLLFCFSQIALDRYMDDLKSDGILLYDASRILEIPDRHQRIYDFPIISKAIEYFSSESMAAIIGIGIIGDFMDIVSPRALELALKARIPKGTEELNEQALKIGYELAKLKHGTAEFNA